MAFSYCSSFNCIDFNYILKQFIKSLMGNVTLQGTWTRSNTLFPPYFTILPLLPLFRVIILAIINISISLSSARARVSFELIFKTDIYFEIYQTCNKRETIKRMLIVTCDYVTVHSSWKYTFLLIFEEIILFFEVFNTNS